MSDNTSQEAKITVGSVIAILVGLIIIGSCVFAALKVGQDTIAAKNILEEAVDLRDEGKYREAIDAYLEIPKEYPLSLNKGKYLTRLLDNFPRQKIFETALDLRGRYGKYNEDYFINTAVHLYEYLAEKYPEIDTKAEVEKINAEIEKMGEPLEIGFTRKETENNLNGESEVTISHNAGDDIEILFSGPSSERIIIPDGRSETVLLDPGEYTIGIKDADISNKVDIRSDSFIDTFQADRSYEYSLDFETVPSY